MTSGDLPAPLDGGSEPRSDAEQVTRGHAALIDERLEELLTGPWSKFFRRFHR